MENVGGRTLVEAGKLCERKNGRGVDTNRNYEVDWGVKEKDYDPNEEYPGTAAYRCDWVCQEGGMFGCYSPCVLWWGAAQAAQKLLQAVDTHAIRR